MEGYHKSVLLAQILDNLVYEDWVVDATLGDGGYSFEVLKRVGRIIGIDVDDEALERTRIRFEEAGFLKENYILVKGNFRDLKELVFEKADGQEKKIRAVIFDLGVSSLQLESPERGFALSKDGPLDMRMDKSLQVSALDLVNGLTKGELNELFTKLGEEKFSKRFAEAVVQSREIKRIETTKELADVIQKASRGPRGKIHPATRVFQALRIAVNDELNVLRTALPDALDILERNGKVVVISFHSLEDRIVKNEFNDWEGNRFGNVETKKPVEALEEEVLENPRSRSAKLRVFIKS